MAIRIPSLPMSGTELKVALDGLRDSIVVRHPSVAAMLADADLVLGDRVETPDGAFDIVAAGSATANSATVHDLTGIAGQAVLDRFAILPDIASLLADTRAYFSFAEGDRIFLLAGERFIVTTPAAVTHDLITAGGLKLAVVTDVENITAFGGALDGTTDDAPAINRALAGTGTISLPRGDLGISGTIEAETAAAAWNGMTGIGHETVLKLGPTGRIIVQNRSPGGALGLAHFPQQGIEDLTIDGQFKTAPYGVIVGTDTDAGQTSINASCNGAKFENVGIVGCGVGWACGFSTANAWINCFTRDCDYGWFISTTADFTAADMWMLANPIANSHDIAAIAVVSDSTNAVTGTITGGMVNDNAGWGAVFAGAARDSYTLTGTHFESNGTEVAAPAPDVAVKQLGLNAEPGHLYASRVALKLTGCAFYGGFIRAENGATLDFEGGAIYAGVAGSDHLDPFRDTDSSATLTFRGGLTLNNPGIDTDATIKWDGEARITGTANDRLFVRGRLPATVKAKARGLLADPCFDSNLSGFTGSITPPLGLARSIANPYRGTHALRVTYSAIAGSLSTNALWYTAISTLDPAAYLACSMFLHSNKPTVLRLGTNTAQFGNNMGTARIALPAGEWVRIGVLWRNLALNIQATDVLISLWPEEDEAPVIDVDCADIAKGSYADVQPTLQGYVGLI